VASQFMSVANTTNDQVKQFLHDIASVDKNAPTNDLAAGSWSAIYTFADVADHAATVDAAGLKAALESGGKFEAPMTAGPIQFTTPSPGLGLPRAFNVLQTYVVVKDGALVSANDNQFTDPYVRPQG
jgi:hypothetical protein